MNTPWKNDEKAGALILGIIIALIALSGAGVFFCIYFIAKYW